MSNDTIYREDAIKAINARTNWYQVTCNGKQIAAMLMAKDVNEILEKVPSADRPQGEVDAVEIYEKAESQQSRTTEQTMIISKSRYKDLIEIINSQKQLIEEYKGKVTLLEEQDELKSQLIRKLERLVVRRTDDE